MTTYTFGPRLHEQFSRVSAFQTLSKQEEVFVPLRIFGFRIECDPSLPADTYEIRGIANGKPYVKRYKLEPGSNKE